MFKKIVRFSIRKKLFVVLTTLFLMIGGIYSMLTLPIDAVPDITNNQVQIVTVSPTLAPQEVEQLITFPIEVAMSNIMNVEEIRSVSRFGLSLVTVVFKESVPTLDARQLVNEQIQTVAGEIPSELGVPEMMPITTGLGEIYQYVLKVAPGYEDKYDAMELRTIQDWIVKRQLSGIPGIVEINSFGGYLKQYEVAVDPDALYSLNITISDVYDALSRNNQNTGGSYIEKVNRAYYIRSEGMITDLKDIEQIVVTNRGGIPVHVSDIAKVRYGAPKRFGAMTKDGEGECVGGIAMMLKGANANVVTQELEKRVAKVQKMLPEGVSVEPYLNRSELVNRNISTVIRNLVEGAIIVFLVLILFLGNVRAGLIVASVIPLAMLFAFILMRVFGVSANLMSLGAIDFGIVVDGSIVILEGILAHIYGRRLMGRTLSKEEMDAEVEKGAGNVVRSATFAVLIILIVFFPILTLTGIEGKYFTPMAKTLVFCIIGALLLSLTYVPMMASLFLKRTVSVKPTLADRFFEKLNRVYRRTLDFCLSHVWGTLVSAFTLLILSFFLFTRLGAEFIPTLDEGDFAMQMTLPAGSSLSRSIEVSLEAEKKLKQDFPEIKHVVAKIGTAEVPTDPMAVEDADVMIVMKPFSEWTSASSRAEMVEKMKKSLETVEGAEFNFSQPIQLRFNELMTGAKADIAIKLYGEDMTELYAKAKEAAKYVEQVPGAADVLVEQAMGLPQLLVKYDRSKIARYGIDIEELNSIIRTAYAGETAGVVFENERRFDLVLRLDNEKVKDLNIDKLFVRTGEGIQIPVSEVASIDLENGPLQINRDATKRRIVIGVNVRDADIQQVVEQIRTSLEKNIKLKPGYYWEYGGQFENLQNAVRTLSIVIPIALMLILLLLFFAFRSVIYSLVVFSTVPLSLIGGVVALWLRGLPFSISAGVGFIALFGVAVLNGILMINHFNDLRKEKTYTIARYGIDIEELNSIIRTAYAGETAGVVFENERRFDLVLRLDNEKVKDLNIDKLFVRTGEGIQIPVSEVASIDLENGPLQINRDATKRRIVIGVNVRDADIQQVVEQIRTSLEKNIKLKPGYYWEYGGQFENLQNAVRTLSIVIPIALMLILLLLFFAFRSVIYSLVVFSTVPLSLIGGVVALWLRGLPFSISAGVGFIALFGVAVLNGILMINHFNDLRKEKTYTMCTNRIIAKGCPHLLRPVFLTGLVASLGFVPMAVATSAGAEVQRPLATVVIGGLIVSTVLTLIVIPVFYRLVNVIAHLWGRKRHRARLGRKAGMTCMLLLAAVSVSAVTPQKAITLDEAVEIALQNHPRLKMASAEIERSRAARGEVWDGGNTLFSYSWGQLNGEYKKDNELAVEQSLGSLLTPFYKNALVNAQVTTGTHYRDMVKKEIVAEVKRAWVYYQYAFHLYHLYGAQEELALKLRESGDLRYQQGDIDQTERNMIATLAAELHTRSLQAREEMELASRRFAWACYAGEQVVPNDSSLAVLPLSLQDRMLSAPHLNYFASQVQEKKSQLRIERSKFFPEFSLGYVRQKIAPLNGLNSWIVGVSFPILFFPQRSRSKQAKVSLQIAQWEADQNRVQLNNKVEELYRRVRQQQESLDYYAKAALKEADALQESALMKFKESEINITEFVQSLNASRDIRRNYIETVYAYNVSVLEIELYTE
jgi:CzcA family heavy metal efflux pump